MFHLHSASVFQDTIDLIWAIEFCFVCKLTVDIINNEYKIFFIILQYIYFNERSSFFRKFASFILYHVINGHQMSIIFVKSSDIKMLFRKIVYIIILFIHHLLFIINNIAFCVQYNLNISRKYLTTKVVRYFIRDILQQKSMIINIYPLIHYIYFH